MIPTTKNASDRELDSDHESDRDDDRANDRANDRDSALATRRHHREVARDEADRARPTVSARTAVMNLLARRDHSPLEIRRKLGERYSADEVESAIAIAQESGWLAPVDELASRVGRQLDMKKKGHRFIQNFLRQKGLPNLERNFETEVEKARAIVRSKLRLDASHEAATALPQETRIKAHRWLANRGFDDDVIRCVINEKY